MTAKKSYLVLNLKCNKYAFAATFLFFSSTFVSIFITPIKQFRSEATSLFIDQSLATMEEIGYS